MPNPKPHLERWGIKVSGRFGFVTFTQLKFPEDLE